MNEQVLTIITSACAASFVISMPSFMSEPSMISASTRFLAQPSEMRPTLSGAALDFGFVTGAQIKPMAAHEQSRVGSCWAHRTNAEEHVLPSCPVLPVPSLDPRKKYPPEASADFRG